MSIPVVMLPEQGPIHTRPRREGYYDTERWDASQAITSKLTIFRNMSAFSNTTGAGQAKTKGLHHNFDNNGGQLPKGQAFHWYSVTNAIRPMGVRLASVAPVVWDVKRRIRESTWWTFFFGNDLVFIQAPTWFIPEGVGLPNIYTTRNAQTIVGSSQAELSRLNGYDVSLSGQPTEITQLETFHVDIEASGVTPTPTVDLYDTVTMRGIALKGLQ